MKELFSEITCKGIIFNEKIRRQYLRGSFASSTDKIDLQLEFIHSSEVTPFLVN